MWAFKVNDVDAVQAAGDLVDAHTQEASSKMQTAMDKAILDEGLETTNKVTKVGEEKAYDLIVKANTALNKNKVPKTDRFVVVNAEVLEELHLDDRFNRHYQILENGVIEGASVNGTQLVYSEELNGGSYAILALHKTAIGFGTQLQETEAMRLESDFADGIRGLQVAGAKTLRPKAVVKYVQE
jgi:pyruvate carboxylase